MKFNGETDEKGLFTFYRQQAEQEERMKRKRNKKKANPDPINPPAQVVSSNIDRAADQPSIKQPAISTSLAQLKHLQSRTQSLPRQLHQPKYAPPVKKRYGESVIVINRDKEKSTENTHNQQLNDKTPQNEKSGRYIKNRELQFQNGVKRVNQSVNRRKGPKKLVLNYRYPRSSFDYANAYPQTDRNREYDVTDRVYQSEYDKLPTLNKEPSEVTYLIPKRYKSKLLEQALKTGGNELLRQIRGKIIQQNHSKVIEDNLHGSTDFSVSYVEYGSAGWQQKKSGEGLNHKQKRILQLLHNYRKI